jgi:hypothetical protein
MRFCETVFPNLWWFAWPGLYPSHKSTVYHTHGHHSREFFCLPWKSEQNGKWNAVFWARLENVTRKVAWFSAAREMKIVRRRFPAWVKPQISRLHCRTTALNPLSDLKSKNIVCHGSLCFAQALNISKQWLYGFPRDGGLKFLEDGLYSGYIVRSHIHASSPQPQLWSLMTRIWDDEAHGMLSSG